MKFVLLSLSLTLSTLSACKREGAAPSASGSSARASSQSTPRAAKKEAKASDPAAGAVARIVFVDKEKCCECTRKRIDDSWKALTDVVGFPPVPDVERVHMDSQPTKAEPYTKQRAIVVPPAIYFFDKQGKLLEVLQGEVKSTQVRKALGGSS